jgi:hypothetical protein
MIILINGWPGVGKLTVGRALAGQLAGRLLDNHTIYNVAFSLTEFKTPEFYDAVRGVRRVAFDAVAKLSTSLPVVITACYAAESSWGNESWDEIVTLARSTGRKFLVVALECGVKENVHRVQNLDRASLRKLLDPKELLKLRSARELLTRDAEALFRIDNTTLAAEDCAGKIAAWVKQET